MFLKEEGFPQAPFEEIVGRKNEEATKQKLEKDYEQGVDVLSRPILVLT